MAHITSTALTAEAVRIGSVLLESDPIRFGTDRVGSDRPSSRVELKKYSLERLEPPHRYRAYRALYQAGSDRQRPATSASRIALRAPRPMSGPTNESHALHERLTIAPYECEWAKSMNKRRFYLWLLPNEHRSARRVIQFMAGAPSDFRELLKCSLRSQREHNEPARSHAEPTECMRAGASLRAVLCALATPQNIAPFAT